MNKVKLIIWLVRIATGLAALGIGIWYLSSSIGGAALTYTSMDNFMTAIGANGNVANVHGCFLCSYISQLFAAIGNAAELFWNAMVDNLWILLVIGFGIFIFIYSIQYIYDAMTKTANFDTSAKNLEFKGWFDKIWKQGVRVLFVGALIGALGMGGNTALRTITNITVTPVMFVGAELSMLASGVATSTECTSVDINSDSDILNPILQPFMCTMGNLNSVMLAGAAGGFALMNYTWLGLGGGILTWIAGLALVLMFLIIGFNLFFQVLSVVFKLMFIIIFMPLILAAAAFEQTWALAGGVVSKAINMLIESAVKIITITLKILIVYATVSYVADQYFPEPADGYSAILPPMLWQKAENPDAQTMSVINVFSECERVSLTDGVVGADKFKSCFLDKKAQVEARYPHAFDFLSNGWEFFIMMIMMFFLYYWVINPRVEKLLGGDSKEQFDFGGDIKQLGQSIWNLPNQIAEKLGKHFEK